MATATSQNIDLPRTSEQTQFQSISVLCSNRVNCNAQCAFCIARGAVTEKHNSPVKPLDFDLLKVGLAFARQIDTPKAIITSKADPLQENPRYLLELIRLCQNYLGQVDLHTNGLGFIRYNANRRHVIENMRAAGLSMLTLSLASFDQTQNTALMGSPLFHRAITEQLLRARNAGLWARCSLVVNKSGVADYQDVLNYIAAAKKHGAHAVIIREVWIPSGNTAVAEWARQNYLSTMPIQKAFDAASRQGLDGITVTDGAWDIPTYDINGLDVTFARCEDTTPSRIIRTLVHESDGHGYANWSKKGSTLY